MLILAHGDVGHVAAWWLAWSADPWIVAGLAVLAWLYGRGLYRLWQHAGIGRGVARWQLVAFVAGWLALAVALLSPLEYLSDWSFAAHMGQHLLLLMIAPPLLLLGAPPVGWAWAMPRWGRRPFYHLNKSSHLLSSPLLVWSLYAVALWLWHVPLLYEAAVHNPWIHALEHACFLGTAVLFWWAVAQPGARAQSELRRSLRYGISILFVFTTALHSTLLGVLITFAAVPWYAVYAERSSHFGLTPLADQQLAGAIMWVPGGIVYLLTALFLLYALIEQKPGFSEKPGFYRGEF